VSFPMLAVSPLIAAILGLVVVLSLVIAVVVRRIHVAGPNEAFIITGRRSTGAATGGKADLSGQKVVMGASVFVLPFVQQLNVLGLSSRRLSVSIRGAVSAQGVKVDLEGVAIVKVGGNEDLIRAAAQRFLNQQGEIETFTQEVLAGSLRSIVGGLTVEEIIRDRAAFAAKVAEESEVSLTGQGLVLDTFQIQDVRTEGSYLDDLGRPEQARVKQEAAIAEARARQEAERERLLAEEAIALAERNLELKRAEIQVETDAARARADASGPLAAAERDQMVLEEQEKVAIRKAALTDRQLDTEVRKPADAARYQLEQEAEAAKNAAIFRAEADRQTKVAQAQAEAEAARLVGEGERSKRAALAEAVRIEGQAEADATLARGEAEAAAMEKKADAFARYGEAAVLEMVVAALPETVAAAAAPLAAIDKLTVISADGANQLPKQVGSNIAQGLEIFKDVTGADIKDLIGRYLGRSGSTDT
jgi:flotillin